MEENGTAKISIDGQFSSSINFAMQQNYVPVIKNLVIHNHTEERLYDLTVKISFEPAFAREYSCTVAGLEGGASVEISPVQIILSTEYLFSLTERVVGIMEITVVSEEMVLGSYQQQIDVLAYDQWSGLFTMPEMIAAFVTPNHPSIAQILTKASEILGQWNATPSFTGYQTQNPNQVKLQMAAIYASMHGEHIIYNNPPASFEETGQRIRMPHVLLEQRQGTCLDLSILYASCLEAAGLHPLLVFTKGHAFAGAWLEEQTFADCAVDDAAALEKRMAEGAEELLLVECTDFVEGKKINFETATEHGKNHLLRGEAFDYVVDIRRCRISGIRPVPVKLEQAYTEGYHGETGVNDSTAYAQAPKALENSLSNREIAQASDMDAPTRLKVWERKLLDFSLRNTLLNFRATKNTIQLMTADLGELENLLAEGKDFRLLEAPAEWTSTGKDIRLYENVNEKDLMESIAGEEIKNSRIRTFLTSEELEKSLKGLQRAARVSIEENGSNTLYLALGFLKWYESDVSEKARLAPLVLVPVDLVRNFRNKGYVIRSRDEETQVNITLLEYLRQDHGIKISGLDPLPCDDSGIDLPLVFHTIRQAIMEKRRWNIENMAFVGLFSFGRFVMWNDLRTRSADLLENKVVASLMEGRMTWTAEDFPINQNNLDEKILPESMAVPLSADSSQMVAIAEAGSGQSFVLHGPPGTGKSQTISNMIANALYQGKSVLFVAEKMAALSVVKKRLEKIGLGPFCLELHSNKANKTSVLNQLNEALEVGRIKNPEEYQATAERIKEVRSRLGYMMEALHKKREYGCSVYEAISLYEQNIAQKGKLVFTREQVTELTGDQISHWMELVKKYEAAAEITGDFNQSPWAGYEGTEYSMELREVLGREFREMEMLCRQAAENADRLGQLCGIASGISRTTVEKLLKPSDAIGQPAQTLGTLLASPDYEGIVGQLEGMIKTGQSYQQCLSEVLVSYEQQILQYPAGEASLRYQQAQTGFVLSKWMQTNKLIKEMRLYAKDKKTVTKESLPAIYDLLNQLAALQNELNSVPAAVTSFTGGIYAGVNTDFVRLQAALDKTMQLHEAVTALSVENKEEVIQRIVSGLEQEKMLSYAGQLAEVLRTLDEMTGKYHINLSQEENSSRWLSDTADTMARFAGAMDSFKEWVNFNRVEQQVKQEGLPFSQLVDAYHDGTIKMGEMQSALSCNLYFALCAGTISTDEQLNHFQGSRFENTIAEYDALLENFKNLTIQELVAGLSAKIPNSALESAASSEMGILKKAIKSNGRMMSIRKLFNEIPALLRRLSPCMLMSPISVAQYIDPKFPRFDLVIFDEASQLETSEAVGTIARGENVVVVGDPKQLPPTSFFSSNHADEENYEQEDLESLLDDCLAISMPQEYLKWHYRSRHESLIAYSNAKYYDNKLYTFPSPNDLVSEVRLVHVEGSYDKGKTKQNRAEAKAVVEEIIRRLQDEELRKDSIGVVTFSSVQQNLIEDMLLEEFAKNPELADLDAQSAEPVFIKNLENVQGDERDVILFSVGYGPDENGKVSMNFGPLNQEGGWRRLNVAITRARKSMIVYAVIRPEQIDLSRTRSEGVAGLKGFLEYAERGRNALAVRAQYQEIHKDELVEEIAGAIEAMGYAVKTNIGDSKYKLDIGVIHPEKPEVYLLGIMLDGENSRETSRSQDRYILQPGVLKGLGWNTMRIWALDYMDNSGKVLDEIDKKLKELLEQEKNAVATDETTGTNRVSEKSPVFEKLEESDVSAGKKLPYQSVQMAKQGTAENFYEPQTQDTIRRMAVQILIAEAPISRKLLMRKVLAAWEISRTGTRVENIFQTAIRDVQKSETKEDDQIFYWRSDQDPETYDHYRAEDQSGNHRSMDEIAVQEIFSAVMEVLMEQISLSREDLIRETARKFGYTRLGAVIEKAVGDAVLYGINRGRIRETDGKITAAS